MNQERSEKEWNKYEIAQSVSFKPVHFDVMMCMAMSFTTSISDLGQGPSAAPREQ